MPGEFYFQDGRVDLVPSEHLAVDGIDGAFANRLAARPGWTSGHVAFLEQALELYLQRYEELAAQFSFLSPPRLRTLGVVSQPDRVRPYARILNESTSTLYLDDLDPAVSHPEFAAFILALAERREETGEILLAALHLAPWWFDRTPDELEAFATAAQRSARPDADSYRAIAASLHWLKKLRHRQVRPARRSKDFHEIAGTGLLVPHAERAQPEMLMERIRSCASAALASFYQHHRGDGDPNLRELVGWLCDTRPPLVVTDANQSIVWTPGAAAKTVALEARLSECGPTVLQSILEDLRCMASHTQNFLDSLCAPDELAPADPNAEQRGYAFMHRTLGQIAYNLDEPAIERLRGPAIPYARAMLGARTAHEWAHRAVDSGWVVRTMDESQWTACKDKFAELLDGVVQAMPPAVREPLEPDLNLLARDGSVGRALSDSFEKRIEDFSANLIAVHFQSGVERESYVRQNVRPLRKLYPPAEKLRALVRYLYEVQYLQFSSMADARTYFFETTWFEVDFFESGFLDPDHFEALSEAAAVLCHAHTIEKSRFRFGT